MTDPNYTHLALIVDRSGSMSGIAQDMNGGIRQLLKDQDAEPGRLLVDVCTFDNVSEFVFTDAPAATVQDVDLVVPRGSTALNDAIGQMINRLGNKFKVMPEEKRPSKVVVVIVTDGMENASREFTADQVKAMVEQQTGEWGWTFMYLAANVDAFATGAGYGFGAGQTIAYAGTPGGTQNVWEASSANITRSRNGDNSGYTVDERDSAMENKTS